MGNMIDLDVTIFVQLANFLITLVVLNYLLIKPVRDQIAARSALTSGYASDIERFTSQAEEKLSDSQTALQEAMSNSDIQFFTYFPGKKRGEIQAVSNRLAELPTVWNDFPDDFLAYHQGTLSQYCGMRGPVIQTDEYPSTESCARSVIDRIKSGRIS